MHPVLVAKYRRGRRDANLRWWYRRQQSSWLDDHVRNIEVRADVIRQVLRERRSRARL